MSISNIAEIVRSEPSLVSALGLCVDSLRRLADYQLDERLNQHMLSLGERKEFLGEGEHAELLSLVEFTEQRTLEKLEARLALARLGELLPDLVRP